MPEEHQLELNPDKSVVYHLVAGLLRTLATVWFRPSVTGRSNIPLEGPVIIAPIHRSNVDFAFTLFMSPRKVFFMAKDSLFRQSFIGSLLTHLGAFPVRRGAADREAMRASEEVLRQGHALVMFPEGTRKEGYEVLALHDGVMFVAARTGATVIPVGIGGSERAMPVGSKIPRPFKVRIVIGEPIRPPSSEGRVARAVLAEKSEELRAAIERLYHESQGA